MEFYTCVNRYGSNILYRGYDAAGQRLARKIKFSPTLYLKSQKKTGYTCKSVSETVDVEPRLFDTMSDARDYIKKYKDISNFKVYGNQNYVSQYIYEKFPEAEIPFNRDIVNVTIIDIEVASNDGFPFPEDAKHEVISITIKNNIDDTYYVWGLKDYDASISIVADSNRIVYKKCDSEAKLLLNFLDHWHSETHCPDIVTGWNIRLFDIPYLVNRIHRTLGEDISKKLSPWNVINYRQVNLKGKTLDTYELYGIQQMDYYDLFQKFAYSYGAQESYKLDHIAFVVLGENKLSYDEYSNLSELYNKDPQKFIDYNIKDCLLVERLDDKLKLITLSMTMAYRGGVNYTDTFGTTMIWDTIIYRYLMNQNMIVPPNENKQKVPYAGGYVKDPHVGMHEWVCSFDLNSLYPNIIVQWNMSPETLIANLQPNVNVENCLTQTIDGSAMNMDYTLAANGARFTKEGRGIVPSIVAKYYDDRKAVKKKMLEAKQKLETIKSTTKDLQDIFKTEQEITLYENQQMAIKILLNSLYGAIGSAYFRYFDLRIAEGITLTGQMVIRWGADSINKKINNIMNTKNIDYVIASDTDSLYVNMAPLVKKFNPVNPVGFLDEICAQVLEKEFNTSYNNLYEYFNCIENRMEMSREVIADRGIWTAKKRYILNVHNSEGVQYAEPKLKIMGIEAIKSSTPAPCRAALKDIFKVIMTGSEIKTQESINTFKEFFKTLKPEQISFPRGVNDLKKWADNKTIYKKGTPIHVRGALLYNTHIKKLGLDKKYAAINNGDKIKFCYLKTPNTIHENVISFSDYLPPELQLNKYLDYDLQFEKTFLDVINPILEAIKWSSEETSSLDSFFS